MLSKAEKKKLKGYESEANEVRALAKKAGKKATKLAKDVGKELKRQMRKS